jgi:hypothetical protein
MLTNILVSTGPMTPNNEKRSNSKSFFLDKKSSPDLRLDSSQQQLDIFSHQIMMKTQQKPIRNKKFVIRNNDFAQTNDTTIALDEKLRNEIIGTIKGQIKEDKNSPT